jgi:membrane-bound toxin of toxin-antitoxin system
LSARYSSSPTLRLPIAESRICALWQGAFIISLALALVQLALRGYPWLAATLMLIICCLVPALCRQAMTGQVVHWRQGNWYLERGGVETLIRLHSSCRASPLGIYLCWCNEGGARESVWLFADSAPPEQLRRLRVRLALEG